MRRELTSDNLGPAKAVEHQARRIVLHIPGADFPRFAQSRASEIKRFFWAGLMCDSLIAEMIDRDCAQSLPGNGRRKFRMA